MSASENPEGPAAEQSLAVLEQVVVGGDLAKLNPHDRLLYYKQVCESVGLNPFTRPLEYITLQGKLVLYAAKNATDQLRDLKDVSITSLEEQKYDDLYVVTAKARNGKGREDMAKGAVSLAGLRGQALADMIMKCETKAKRRVTLSICGLGMLDETEVETIASAQKVDIDPVTGTLRDPDPAGATNRSVVEDAPDPVTAREGRDLLMGQIKGAADMLGLKASERADLWSKHCGHADPRTVDIAALHDLLADLRQRRS
jgi:hypothetical protein